MPAHLRWNVCNAFPMLLTEVLPLLYGASYGETKACIFLSCSKSLPYSFIEIPTAHSILAYWHWQKLITTDSDFRTEKYLKPLFETMSFTRQFLFQTTLCVSLLLVTATKSPMPPLMRKSRRQDTFIISYYLPLAARI